jgi:putative ABC transport system substrate-binding protein
VGILRALPNISGIAMQVTTDAAQALGFRLRTYDVAERGEWPPTFAKMAADKCDATLQFTDARFADGVSNLVVLAAADHLPAIYGEREFVDAGGVVSYGISFPEQWRRTAAYVDKIIKCAKTGDLPIKQPTRFALITNINTARALNLSLPPSVVARRRGDRIAIICCTA